MSVTRGSSKIKTKDNAPVNKVTFTKDMSGFQRDRRQPREGSDESNDATEYVPNISADLLDKEDDLNDKKVSGILELLKKIEHFNGTQLTGNERRKYLQKKLIELGVVPPKDPNIPFKARIKRKESDEKREKQAKEDARYTGMLKVKSKRR